MDCDIVNLTDEDVIERIIKLNEGLASFWGNSRGWAPIEAAKILTKSRLDWQVSLSRQLKLFLNPIIEKEAGTLILAWSALGSLTEGTMKLFLSVWYNDYKNDIKAFKKKNDKIISPDTLTLEKLRVFFADSIYKENTRKLWEIEGAIDWIDWVLFIQQKRNAIHAFEDRDIGDFDIFFQNVRLYLQFLRNITDDFPYPDMEFGTYKPSEI